MRSLEGIGYDRKLIDYLSKRLNPTTALIKQGLKFLFTPVMQNIARQLLHDLAKPPVMVFPDRNAVAATPAPSACTVAPADGFGATLKQEQPDGSVRPILFISRSTLDNERSWTPLDLEAGSIGWAIK